MGSPVSLVDMHGLTPIKDYDEVEAEVERAGLSVTDRIWLLDRVPVNQIPYEPVEPISNTESADLDQMTAAVLADEPLPPVVLFHSPGYTGGGLMPGDYFLLDGAHRWTAHHAVAAPTLLAWVAHHDGCCSLLD